MTLIVNGEPHEVAAGTLAEALQALDYGEAKVATALNGEFVPTRARGATPVKEGDRIEILRRGRGDRVMACNSNHHRQRRSDPGIIGKSRWLLDCFGSLAMTFCPWRICR